jgi:hypothetical protein
MAHRVYLGRLIEITAIVKGFGCRPLERQRGIFGGRCPKASKEGNRA